MHTSFPIWVQLWSCSITAVFLQQFNIFANY